MVSSVALSSCIVRRCVGQKSSVSNYIHWGTRARSTWQVTWRALGMHYGIGRSTPAPGPPHARLEEAPRYARGPSQLTDRAPTTDMAAWFRWPSSRCGMHHTAARIHAPPAGSRHVSRRPVQYVGLKIHRSARASERPAASRLPRPQSAPDLPPARPPATIRRDANRFP